MQLGAADLRVRYRRRFRRHRFWPNAAFIPREINSEECKSSTATLESLACLSRYSRFDLFQVIRVENLPIYFIKAYLTDGSGGRAPYTTRDFYVLQAEFWYRPW